MKLDQGSVYATSGRVAVGITLSRELKDWADKAKGLANRSRFLEHLIELGREDFLRGEVGR
jgi:hypothetical protein